MKKLRLFTFSCSIALGITYYSKKTPAHFTEQNNNWQTFQKLTASKVDMHESTDPELLKARIPVPKRSIAQEENSKSKKKNIPKDSHYQLREERILIGDYKKMDYQNEQTELEMINKINPNWKEILGNDLLRFQPEETKVLIKEEFPVIKIQNGKGQYLEQVVISYVQSDGTYSSFKALVDSDTGFVTETWDRTINESRSKTSSKITLPEVNNSGIKAY